jgi:hypothetical protein
MNFAMTQLSPEQIDRLARRRAAAKMGWTIHALVYVLVNSLLFAISRNGSWPVYPLLGWGIGLAMHGLAVFVLGSGGRIHGSMVQRERERLQQEQARP